MSHWRILVISSRARATIADAVFRASAKSRWAKQPFPLIACSSRSAAIGLGRQYWTFGLEHREE